MVDPPHKHRASRPYLPPPPDAADGSPEPIDVPRMQPPPASLEKMVPSRRGASRGAELDARWLWLAALLVVLAAAGYYILSRG